MRAPWSANSAPQRRQYTDMYTDCAAVAEVAPAQPRTVPETECSRWVEGSYYLDIMYYEVNTAGTFPYFVLYVLKLY